jgi:hypothetical protein
MLAAALRTSASKTSLVDTGFRQHDASDWRNWWIAGAPRIHLPADAFLLRTGEEQVGR